MTDQVVMEHILKQTETMGKIDQHLIQIDERLQEGDTDLKDIKSELKKKASKKDVQGMVDVGLDEHVQAFHPSEAEKVGGQVLKFRDLVFRTKKGQVSLTSILFALVALAKYMGVLPV